MSYIISYYKKNNTENTPPSSSPALQKFYPRLTDDLVISLKGQLNQLDEHTHNYFLLSQIEDTWLDYQKNPLKRCFLSQIESVYQAALAHHDLEDLQLNKKSLVLKAAKCNVVARLHFLLRHPLSLDTMEKAALYGIKYNHQDVVKAIIQSNTLTDDSVSFVIEFTIEFNKYKFFKAFLALACVSENTLENALVKSASFSRVGLVKYLLDNYQEKIPLCAFQEAFCLCFSNLDLLTLLDQATILPETYGNTLESACFHGDLESARFLIHKRQHSQQNTQKALMNASLNNHLSIVQLIIDQESLSEDQRGHAVKIAALHGRFKVLKALLKSGKISQADKAEAINKAQAINNEKIAGYILTHS